MSSRLPRPVRPAVRRGTPVEQVLMALILVVLGAGGALWLTGELAALLHSGHRPRLAISDMGNVLFNVPRHWNNPALAWPKRIQPMLPGPVGFYLVFALVLIVFATVVVLGSSVLQLVRRRYFRVAAQPPLRPPAPPRRPAWASPQAVERLVVRGPTRGRVVLGRVHGRLLAAEPCRSVLALGPTRSQKTAGLVIPAILEWQGPVLATSITGDLIGATIKRRFEVSPGRVFVIDPTGQTGHDRSDWSPLDGSRTWDGAHRMALSLLAAHQRQPGEPDTLQPTAPGLLAGLLLAAATSGRSMTDVVRWVQRQDHNEVQSALHAAEEPAALEAVESVWRMPEQRRSSAYATALGVVGVYADPVIGRSDATNLLTAERLLDGRAGTAYVCAPAQQQRRLGPLLSALVQEVVDAAVERATRLGRPLDPPLLVVLDDAGHVVTLPHLDWYAATAWRHGVQLVTVFRDLGQLHARHGELAEIIVNSHHAKVFMSGISDPGTLTYLSYLTGDESIRMASVPAAAPVPADQPEGAERPAARPFLPGDALRRVAAGQGLLLYGHLPPAYLSLRPWFSDRRLRELAEAARTGVR